MNDKENIKTNENDIETAKREQKGKQVFIYLDKNGNPVIHQQGCSFTELLGIANLLEYVWRIEIHTNHEIERDSEEKSK